MKCMSQSQKPRLHTRDLHGTHHSFRLPCSIRSLQDMAHQTAAYRCTPLAAHGPDKQTCAPPNDGLDCPHMICAMAPRQAESPPHSMMRTQHSHSRSALSSLHYCSEHLCARYLGTRSSLRMHPASTNGHDSLRNSDLCKAHCKPRH